MTQNDLMDVYTKNQEKLKQLKRFVTFPMPKLEYIGSDEDFPIEQIDTKHPHYADLLQDELSRYWRIMGYIAALQDSGLINGLQATIVYKAGQYE